MSERLRATLALLEKVTLAPNEIGPEDVASLRKAGVSDSAILDACYVCVGFNIIARIADALGFEIPTEEVFSRAARFLVIFGYKRLSGFMTAGIHNQGADLLLKFKSVISKPSPVDPYQSKLRRVQDSVLRGPGTVPSAIRQKICDGREISGALGDYGRKVAEHAYLITDDDFAELKKASFTDDQIFEATVSAALGAGLIRLDCVMRALNSERDSLVSAGASLEDTRAPAMTKVGSTLA
jgi:hypothetical protein